MTVAEQVRSKIAEVIRIAREKYNVDLSRVNVSYDLKGRVAGWAQRRGNVYTVKFNHDMLTRGDAAVLKDMLEDTIPHEFAHIVCYMRPELGNNHNDGWRRVCIGLGGHGGRTHNYDVVMGKGTTYEYTTDRGHKVRVGDRHHARIQAGDTLRFRRGKGNVTMACAYSIVGQNGRTLANPIHKPAVNSPAMIEQAVRLPDPATLRVASVTQVRPAPAPAPVATAPVAGESKAATSRRIMLSGYRGGQTYEAIIAAMIAANGYDRQLARATFKANAPKVGIPASFY